jgi:myo-inositol 2-dehydrogenase/D-chiro-inositol 1-dehydrogenase
VTLRVGVAGLGGMGLVHARNVLGTDGSRLVAVASTRTDEARATAAELGVRAASYDELFADADVDAVVLAARSIDHAERAVAVLEAGKHLFLEKPGATALAAHDLVRAAAAARPGQVVQVGYNRRFDARWREARRLIDSGAIGRPLLVTAISRDVKLPVPEDPVTTGGFLVDMAVHDYDAACWFLGQEPVEAFAARQWSVYPELEALGDLDNAAVTLRFDGGGIASFHISRTCPWGHDVRLEVVGDEGSVLIGNEASHAGVTLMNRASADGFPQDYRELFTDGYAAELAVFVAACRGEGPAGPSLDDDRRALAAGVAVRASAVAGRALEVGPDWPWP